MIKEKKKVWRFGLFLITIIFFLCFSSNIVFAMQSTQQSNKIFFSPFYYGSSTQNTNIPFTLIINPPDKIDKIISAVINFDVWINPSVNFTLLINGKSCNNPSYYISTTYASAGKTIISFDCNNIITYSGIYSVILKANKDTGALTGWIDLTFINNPLGELKLSGTEYSVGDIGKVFLQLLDNNKAIINNASCYVKAFNPDISIYLNTTLMASTSEGFYYYDFNPVPLITGVYMISAFCDVPATANMIANDDFECGGFNCGAVGEWLTDWVNVGTNLAQVTTTAVIYGSYNMRLRGSGVGGVTGESWRYVNTNITNCSSSYLSFYAKTGAVTGTNNCTYQYMNGTGSNITLLTLGSGDTTYTYYSYNICPYGAKNNVGIKLSATNGMPITSVCYIDNVNFNLINIFNETQYQRLMGSGEMHITNIPQTTANLINATNYSQIAQSVWNYNNRNLTYYEDVTNYSNIAYLVWNWGGTITNNILDLFSNSIWNFVNRTLTFTEDVTNYSQIAEYVWTYSDRNLTFYEINNIAVEDIWNYASRNLTFTEDVTNYSQIAEYVWFYVDRNLTTFPTNNITAEDIWNYYNRSLTQDIPMQIWSYPNRNLTTDIPFDVWSYYNRTLTYYTINLTELINMINEYDFTETPILIPIFENQFISYTLNVTLIVPI